MTVIDRLREAVSNLVTTSVLLTLCGWAVSSSASDVATLTPIEQKWLDAADPVLQFAIAQGLPIDVVVRPDDSGEVPFSIAVENNRCKLILSMRNRVDAEATLADMPDSQHAILIEAMTAHEMAHCWRYTQGEWNSLPLGMTEPQGADSDHIAKQRRAMRSVQSEEAYADLVALAWTQWQHPAQYREVHAWLVHVRDDQPVEGSFHDTRAWLALAQDASVFMATRTPFQQVQTIWLVGLKSTATRH